MTCTRFEKSAARYAGSDLSPSAAIRFERHLAGCADCRRLVDDLREDGAALAALREEEVPGPEYAAIRAAVHACLDAGPAKVLGGSSRWLRPRFTWAGVGALLVVATVLIGLLLWRPDAPTLPAPTAREQGPTQPAGIEPTLAGSAAASPRTGTSNPATSLNRQAAAEGKSVRRRAIPKRTDLATPRWKLVESSPGAGDIRPPAIIPQSIQPARIEPPASIAEPLVIRLITDDPAVTIVWLAESQGGTP
jgi:hypothetical protein